MPWFEQATAEDILAPNEIDWHGDYAADAVALFFKGKSNEVTNVLAYLTLARKVDADVGFECHVDEDLALAWLKIHRAAVRAKILCNNNDVARFTVDGPAGATQWLWQTCDGLVSKQHFATFEEAEVVAVAELQLS